MERKIRFFDLRLTGMLLIISSVIFLVAATFFTIRLILELPVGNMPAQGKKGQHKQQQAGRRSRRRGRKWFRRPPRGLPR